MTENSGGDRLASGATKFQFRPMGSKLTQEQWDNLWKEDNDEQRTGDTNAAQAGNAGLGVGESQSGQ